ncbi:PPC domain-containing DNA-binding protein [Photobacterium sp. MCCC 1A19761]|uniref:PPC domain-containing DNA-binding protein n=1 Tax=Photobacterium sp. MCCC 1A19761 TaxID=3115000 RepID=UPI00307CD37D
MLTPHAFRLSKGQPLKQSILDYLSQHTIQASSMLSGVGCLTEVDIRLADERQVLHLDGPLEILTLSGTLTPKHAHLHISVADQAGRVYGGHLVEGRVSYTAEVCLASYENLVFQREFDPQTGFDELVVSKLVTQ